MQKTLKIKLLPSEMQQKLVSKICEEYSEVVNRMVSELVAGNGDVGQVVDIGFHFPTGVKKQAIEDARTIFETYESNPDKGNLMTKKPYCKWESDDVSIMGDMVAFPIVEGGKYLLMKAVIPDHYRLRLARGFSSLKVHRKSNKFIGTLSVMEEDFETDNDLTLEEVVG